MQESLSCRAILLLFGFSCFPALGIAAESLPLRLPDEIEVVGGQGTAQGHGGSASLNDLAAIRLNPAMIFNHRSYDVGGAYYWPSTGRPFYKAGVIDGVTSQIVMGFEYTGFQDQLKPIAQRKELDSPVYRRTSVAVAVPAQFFAVGGAAHYVEAEDPDTIGISDKPLKGISLGAGAVMPLGNAFRLGVSIENFNNKKIAAVAPRTLRAGINWDVVPQALSFNADYRQRQRSLALELPFELADTQLSEQEIDAYDEPERMALFGVQAQTYNMLRFFGSYGRNVEGPERTVASGGLGVFQKNYSLAYAVSKSFPTQDELQSSLHLSVIMKM